MFMDFMGQLTLRCNLIKLYQAIVDRVSGSVGRAHWFYHLSHMHWRQEKKQPLTRGRM